MRQWRVGTISMGLTLITLGVVMFFSMIKGYQVAAYLIKLWPLILIIIGAEILLYLYLSKEESPRVRYDGLSIVMICLISFISIVFYSVTAVGIMPRLATMAAGNTYSLSMALQETSVKPSINKIVVDLPSNFTYFRSVDENKVVLSGQGNVFAVSKENAEGILKNIELVSYEVDNIMHISINGVQRYNDLNERITDFSYSLFIPKGLDVEIKRSSYNGHGLEIDGRDLVGNWLVDVYGSTKVMLNEGSNLFIEAHVNSYDYSGNLDWEVTQKENEEARIVSYKAGDGSNSIRILRGRVEAIKVD